MTSRPDHVILDELDPDEKQRYENFWDRPRGTADPLKIKPKVKAVGGWISDQYNRIPEKSRTELERQLSIGLQPEKWPDGSIKDLPSTADYLNTVYKPIAKGKEAASILTGLDPINFDALEVTADIATLNPKILKKMKIFTNIFGEIPNPVKVSEFVSSGAAAGIVGGNTNIWKRFGYGLDTPTQVKRAFASKRLTLAQKNEISDSLFNFYSKVEKYRISGKTVKSYPLYWVNPVTNDIYKATRKGRRYSLDSKNRYFRELQQSSITQKKGIRLSRDQIKDSNAKLLQEFNEERDLILNQIRIIDQAVDSAGTGKPGSFKMERAIAIINNKSKARQELVKRLEALVEGKVEYYGEHGYNLANERMQKIARSFNNFSLGDVKNFHPTLNRKGFKELKDKFETVINSKNAKGEYNYPGLVVNYNPKLNNDIEYIIRIEDIDSIRLGGKKGIYPEVLHGDSLFEFNFLENSDQLKSVKDIEKFIQSKGYSKTPGPGSVEDLRKYISTDTKPKQYISDTTQRILDMFDD